MESNNEILFQPIEWSEVDIDEKLEIHAWSLRKSSQEEYQKYGRKSMPILVRIINFPAHRRLLLTDFPSRRLSISERDRKVQELVNDINKDKSISNNVNGIRIKRGVTVDGFHENISHLLVPMTNSLKDLNIAASRLTRQNSKYPMMEDVEKDFPQYLRMLMALQAESTGWFSISSRSQPNDDVRISKVEEYIVMFDSDYKSGGFKPRPDIFEILRPVIMSFDIETYSFNGYFPNPNLSENVVNVISAVTFNLDEGANPYNERVVFSFGDSYKSKKCMYRDDTEPNSFNKQPTIYCYPHERMLLEDFQEYIRQKDPDIITGYNIYGFDWPYLDTRIKKITKQGDWKNLSRLKDGYEIIEFRKSEGDTIETKIEGTFFYERSSLSSSGFANLPIAYLYMTGRLTIDLYTYVRQEIKSSRYSLDYISSNNLDSSDVESWRDYYSRIGRNEDYLTDSDSESENPQNQKHDLPAEEMFSIFNRHILKLMNLFHSEEGTEIQKLHLKSPCRVRDSDKFSKIKERDPDLAKEFEDTVKDMTRFVSYADQDSWLVARLMDKLQVWYTIIQLSGISRIRPIEVYTRGKGHPITRLYFAYSFYLGYVMKNLKSTKQSYKGAKVYDPVLGRHEDVCVIDFASLYPYIIMRYNVDLTTLITEEPYEYDKVVPIDIEVKVPKSEKENMEDEDDDLQVKDELEKDNQQEETRTKRVYFVKRTERAGVLPNIVEALVNKRKQVKKEMKKYDPSDFYYKILNTRQLALKIIANSCYGLLGASTCQLYQPDCAQAITAFGRNAILRTKDILHSVGCRVIYGDTDSCMFKPSKDDYSDADTEEGRATGKKKIERGFEMEKYVTKKLNEMDDPNGEFSHKLSMEFEKGGLMFTYSKKKYFIWYYAIEDGYLNYPEGYVPNWKFENWIYDEKSSIYKSKGDSNYYKYFMYGDTSKYNLNFHYSIWMEAGEYYPLDHPKAFSFYGSGKRDACEIENETQHNIIKLVALGNRLEVDNNANIRNYELEDIEYFINNQISRIVSRSSNYQDLMKGSSMGSEYSDWNHPKLIFKKRHECLGKADYNIVAGDRYSFIYVRDLHSKNVRGNYLEGTGHLARLSQLFDNSLYFNDGRVYNDPEIYRRSVVENWKENYGDIENINQALEINTSKNDLNPELLKYFTPINTLKYVQLLQTSVRTLLYAAFGNLIWCQRVFSRCRRIANFLFRIIQLQNPDLSGFIMDNLSMLPLNEFVMLRWISNDSLYTIISEIVNEDTNPKFILSYKFPDLLTLLFNCRKQYNNDYSNNHTMKDFSIDVDKIRLFGMKVYAYEIMSPEQISYEGLNNEDIIYTYNPVVLPLTSFEISKYIVNDQFALMTLDSIHQKLEGLVNYFQHYNNIRKGIVDELRKKFVSEASKQNKYKFHITSDIIKNYMKYIEIHEKLRQEIIDNTMLIE